MTNESQAPKKEGANQINPNINFDKSAIVEKIKLQLIQRRDTYFDGARSAGHMAREADGAMQSRYDTTKIEQSWLANALSSLGESVNQSLHDWNETFLSKADEQVDMGSLILLEDLQYGEKGWFFLMPFGGIVVEMEEQTITALNINSALGQNVRGKGKGHRIEYIARPEDGEIQKFMILEIM